MKKLILIILIILIPTLLYAGLITKYFDYLSTSEVNSLNLNGNFDNIINVVNGDLDNTNMDTASGFRLYEVLGTTPAAGQAGRIIYNSTENSLNFDTGSTFKQSLIIPASPSQGDIVYFDGSNWQFVKAGTSGHGLISRGTSIPIWTNQIQYASDLTITSQAQGDILYFNGTNWTRLAAGTSGQFLKTGGASANPSWQTDYTQLYIAPTSRNYTASAKTKVKELTINTAGTFRFMITIASTLGSGAPAGYLYRNGGQVATASVPAAAGTYDLFGAVAGWSVGDTAAFYYEHDQNRTGISNWEAELTSNTETTNY